MIVNFQLKIKENSNENLKNQNNIIIAMDIIILLTVFGILFLAELGDKTQLIVFNLSLEYEKSYKVGIGAMLGFATIVTIGVFFGAVITEFIPSFFISIFSGIIFIIVGILGIRGVKPLYTEHKLIRNEGHQEYIETASDMKSQEIKSIVPINNKVIKRFSYFKKNPYLAGYLFIFIMELGDKSQLLTITLASLYPLPLEIWLGSVLALSSLAWMGVFFGAIIARKVPKFHLKVVSSVIFIFIGTLILITSF